MTHHENPDQESDTPPRREIRNDAGEVKRLRDDGGNWLEFIRTASEARRKSWQIGAESDAPEALWLTGLCSENGINENPNLDLAAQFFLRAALEGNPDAQYDLAFYWKFGFAWVEKDARVAAGYLKQAADQGHRGAQHELGLILLEGDEAARIEPDQAMAIHWLRCAAQQNHADAQYQLGVLLPSGKGAGCDETILSMGIEALEMTVRTTSCLEDQAIVTVREVLARTEEELLEIRNFRVGCLREIHAKLWEIGIDAWSSREAKGLLLAAAEQGHIEAQFRLGHYHSIRDGACPEALRWFRRAAERGHLESQHRLGERLFLEHQSSQPENGDDPLGLTAEAVEWLRIAAARDHPKSPLALARIFQEYRDLSPVSAEEVVRLLRRVAKGGQSRRIRLADTQIEAQLLLWSVDALGLKVGERRIWLQRAAESGHPEAQHNLGAVLEGKYSGEEKPAERDYNEAAKWYLEAAKQGHVGATQRFLYLQRARGSPGALEASEREIAQSAYGDAKEFEKRLNGTGRDAAKVVELYRRAAELGHPGARYWLAQQCENGEHGMKKDQARANLWYRKAADQGHYSSQMRLAERLVDLGQAIDRDGGDGLRHLQEALVWCSKAEQIAGSDDHEADETISWAKGSRHSQLRTRIEDYLQSRRLRVSTSPG